MNQLALLGGARAVEELKTPAWPPLSSGAEADLVEIYNSRNWSFGGPHEKAFAAEFAAAHDAKFGVFMANGTVTLQCALGVYGIGAGDEVIVPALTWPATAMAVVYLGAMPVFVDVERDTLCMSPAAFEAAITPRTKAVIPVHLYASHADIDAIKAIAAQHNLVVIEDCAHGHGGKWNGKGVGSIGDVGSFSFQQSKTLAAGEGGICLTNDQQIAEKLYRMKHIGYGDGSKQGVVAAGPPEGLPVYNFRATEFQAAILRHQLRDMDALIGLYNRNAQRIAAQLEGTSIHVQSRGRCTTRQSYYALAFTFDQGALAEVPLQLIIEALHAEGFYSAGPTYGVVYRHILFNLPQSDYRIADGGCPVAENIGMGRTAVMLHIGLGADDDDIDGIARALVKLDANAAELLAHAQSKTELAGSTVE